jgi:hypothetical protein
MPPAHIIEETRYEAVEVDDDEIPGGVRYKIVVGSREFEVTASDNEPGDVLICRRRFLMPTRFAGA